MMERYAGLHMYEIMMSGVCFWKMLEQDPRGQAQRNSISEIEATARYTVRRSQRPTLCLISSLVIFWFRTPESSSRRAARLEGQLTSDSYKNVRLYHWRATHKLVASRKTDLNVGASDRKKWIVFTLT